MDGGWTKFNTFEKVPDRWGYFEDIGRVCPVCREKIIEFANDFRREEDRYQTVVVIQEDKEA